METIKPDDSKEYQDDIVLFIKKSGKELIQTLLADKDFFDLVEKQTEINARKIIIQKKIANTLNQAKNAALVSTEHIRTEYLNLIVKNIVHYYEWIIKDAYAANEGKKKNPLFLLFTTKPNFYSEDQKSDINLLKKLLGCIIEIMSHDSRKTLFNNHELYRLLSDEKITIKFQEKDEDIVTVVEIPNELKLVDLSSINDQEQKTAFGK